VINLGALAAFLLWNFFLLQIHAARPRTAINSAPPRPDPRPIANVLGDAGVEVVGVVKVVVSEAIDVVLLSVDVVTVDEIVDELYPATPITVTVVPTVAGNK
jgi:hypothetical protein